MSDDDIKTLQSLWDAYGREIFADQAHLKRMDPEWFKAYLDRFKVTLPFAGLGLAIPCKREVMQETLSTAMSICGDLGITGLSQHGFEVATNREALVNRFISMGFSRLLFLDSDTVVTNDGIKQLMDSMDSTGAAVMAALVKIRETNEYNACLGEDDDGLHIKVTVDNMGSSGSPFPVSHGCLAVAILDLEKIKKHPSPRFQRRVDGKIHYGEDQLFCRWLKMKDLDIWVDPKVQTVHVVPMYLGHSWPPKQRDVKAVVGDTTGRHKE